MAFRLIVIFALVGICAALLATSMSSTTGTSVDDVTDGIKITSASDHAKHQLADDPPRIGSYEYGGCWTEGTNGRGFPNATYSDPFEIRLSECIDFCAQKSFKYAGAEDGSDCWCGDNSYHGAYLASDQGICNMQCPGNKNETCGGANVLSVYEATRIGGGNPGG